MKEDATVVLALGQRLLHRQRFAAHHAYISLAAPLFIPEGHSNVVNACLQVSLPTDFYQKSFCLLFFLERNPIQCLLDPWNVQSLVQSTPDDTKKGKEKFALV